MNALGLVIDTWGKKDPAELACEKIVAAEAAAVELEKAQAALAAAQAAAEKAKLAVEEAVHNLPPCGEAVATEESAAPAASPEASKESDDARIARIVAETLIRMGVVPPQVGVKEPQTTAPAVQPEIIVEKSAVELTLSPAPVVGPTGAKGGNYPASKQTKQRR